jgi:hypothetical protein
MGAVYRARDTNLGRDVALKVLAHSFSDDPDRVARFTREAQVLASLDHPNVATIHGLERVGTSQIIVMELVEGATLEARLARRPSSRCSGELSGTGFLGRHGAVSGRPWFRAGEVCQPGRWQSQSRGPDARLDRWDAALAPKRGVKEIAGSQARRCFPMPVVLGPPSVGPGTTIGPHPSAQHAAQQERVTTRSDGNRAPAARPATPHE